MSSIDDIWASMNPTSNVAKPAAVAGTKKVKKSKDKHQELTLTTSKVEAKPVLDYAAMTVKLARHVQACEEEEVGIRKKALNSMFNTLFVEHDMSDEGYCEVFRDICKKVFKRFADSSEKCRELAQKITTSFFERCSDIVPTLGYYFPALLQRIPPGFAYDEEMKVFVANLEEHDAYRRGRAVDRQDRAGTVGVSTHTVVEPSEEIRLIACVGLLTLIKRVATIGACPVLHPYFQEIVMFLQIQLKDPYPELKVAACNALEVLARIEDYEQGMKFFAVGLVRAILPVLRHRLAKVRVAGVAALHACMVVPDRAKRKASGSEAITDLVGFREDNVLPIAAFYKSEVQINHLAELVVDKSLPVREELARFLYVLLTEIGDRYDHHTRLLPYVLDLMTDENPGVASTALATLQKCGREYEDEHEDEIRDRRQYGIDGDDRINLDKPLPAPFLERPRIGMRLYIRGTCKRFLNALVAELTNWVSTTRLKSAQLLKMLVVLCEEHLTMEAHTLFPAFIKALKFAYDDKDTELYNVLKGLFELLGRYILPEVYVYYVLPRLRGDADVVQFGVDTATRVVVMEFLQSLLSGSKPSLIVPHFDELVSTLTDPFVVPFDSPLLQSAAVEELCTIFTAIKGKGNKVVEAHYVSTGRLSSLHTTVRKAFKFLLLQLSLPALHAKAWTAMIALSQLEADHGLGVSYLYKQHSIPLFTEALRNYEVDAQWTAFTCPEHLLLVRLLQGPPVGDNVLFCSPECVEKLVDFVCNGSNEGLATNVENEVLLALADLLISALSTLTRSPVPQAYAGAVAALPSLCCDKILYAFSSDRVWSRTAAMQRQALCVFSLLLLSPLEVTVKSDHVTAMFAKLSTTGNSAQMNDRTSEEGDSDVLPPLRGEAVLHHAHRILERTVVSFSTTASNPAALRREALVVGTHVLQLVRQLSGRKLKSFAHWEKAAEVDHRTLACQLAVQICLPYLLTALDDSDDAVRIACLQALATTAPLVLSEHTVKTAETNPRTLADACALCDVGSSVVKDNKVMALNCDHIVITLLRQATLPGINDSAEFLDHLNDTLRVICVLDPAAFESIVRAELMPLLGESASELGTGMGKEQLSEFASGLINHVSVLQQFNP